jgi:heterodisulfide reductase subunit C2
MTTVNTAFIETIDPRFNAIACMNCGVCTALCPLENIPLPRMLFRQVMLGLEDKIIENEDIIYSCLLCKMCEANCPAGVPIAENIRLLRNHLNSTLYGLGR